MPRIRRTDFTCTVSCLSSLEHLLVATTAALVDAADRLVVVESCGVDDDDAAAVVLERIVTDAWSGTATQTRHVGWLSAVRALLRMTDATEESWCAAADQTFVVAYRAQGKRHLHSHACM